MTILIIKKSTFDQVQINNVTALTYNSTTKVVTITAASTFSYNLDDYLISILW